MAIEAMTTNGMLHWTCAGGEEDEHCNAPCSAHVSEAVYRLPSGQSGPRGATIGLPPCPACGARCSLKADYSLKDLFKATNTLLDASGSIIGYALKIEHAHNLLVHHWLHQQGLAEYPPVLAMPEREALNDPRIAHLSGTEALTLYWGYIVVQARDPRLESFDMMLQELVPVLTTGERRSIDGASQH